MVYARRHLLFRQLGIPLFLLGLAGLITSLVLLNSGQISWHVCLWYVGATALSLATFGNHSDTAMAWLVQVDRGRLSPSQRREIQEEMDRDRIAALSLKPAPAAATVITLLALLFHGLAATKLMEVL
jgi:hypothetical protein